MNFSKTYSDFPRDVLTGLRSFPKYLSSKYFYDDRGSRIFQKIMQMPEYYLTSCEVEIIRNSGDQMMESFRNGSNSYHLIELGSGDGLKTQILLEKLVIDPAFGSYMPIDISAKANDTILKRLSALIPDLKIRTKTGDYFDILHNLEDDFTGRKIILFLGSNVGNFSETEMNLFMNKLNSVMSSGDLLLIGFDLKKSPQIIQNAYDDPHGLTRAFNMNLLQRINDELDADFEIDKFNHLAQYDPVTGDMKSYLVSAMHQIVQLKSLEEEIVFEANEPIFTELSKKYDLNEIAELAGRFNFKLINNFTDEKQFFVDSLWLKP